MVNYIRFIENLHDFTTFWLETFTMKNMWISEDSNVNVVLHDK